MSRHDLAECAGDCHGRNDPSGCPLTSLDIVCEAHNIMRRCGWHDPKEADPSGMTVAQCIRAAADSLEAGTTGWGALVRVSASEKCADRRRSVIGYPLTPQGAIFNAENHDDMDEQFVLTWIEGA